MTIMVFMLPQSLCSTQVFLSKKKKVLLELLQCALFWPPTTCFSGIDDPKFLQIHLHKLDNINIWASEASPTLGCSIEISRDIYMSVGMSVVVQKA